MWFMEFMDLLILLLLMVTGIGHAMEDVPGILQSIGSQRAGFNWACMHAMQDAKHRGRGERVFGNPESSALSACIFETALYKNKVYWFLKLNKTCRTTMPVLSRFAFFI